MPSHTGVVQDAGVPFAPSISTRQSRQDPNDFTISVAHSFGMEIPISWAARMTLAPSSTSTLKPSISTVTFLPAPFFGFGFGVP